MMMYWSRLSIIAYSIYTVFTNGGFAEVDEEYLRFPPNFLLGSATAAYQIEGAWNVSDKAESTWDRFVHEKKGRINNDETGDDACKAYYKFKEDVALMKEIGFNSYRFSISWPRLLPNGFANKVSEDGLRYYKELINELLANDIEPVVTLYHWDHPQIFEDVGGWLNPEIVDWFGDYSRVVFKEFGSKVNLFITLNEPCNFCIDSYSRGHHAPSKTSIRGFSEYLCLQNILKAHARAYRIYEEEFKPIYNGSVGINVHMFALYPNYPNQTMAVEVAHQFHAGWLLHPIYSKQGDYPKIMRYMIDRKSREQGFVRSRLPELGDDWIEYIRGASDFLSINHYTAHKIQFDDTGDEPSFLNDWGISTSADPSWKVSQSRWLSVVPEGIGDLLRHVSKAYNSPVIYITENGFSTGDEIDDIDRVHYFQEYMKHMLIAINRDGVNVKGYMAWSLLDNFEWDRGYSERFGIIHVNFTDPDRKRTLKTSAYWWKNVISKKRLMLSPLDDQRCENDLGTGTCDSLT